MQVVSKEIAREQRMMMTLGQMSAEARLAHFMVTMGHRFKERGFSCTEFNMSMSRHDLANYLGLAVETLSRLFKKFHQNGWLQVSRRHIKILDWEEMCTAAHADCGSKQSKEKEKKAV
jgi:CRP/FNR family transcriptional regulator